MSRDAWTPKRPEVSEQCASCPFQEDNDAEWGAILGKLRAKLGLKGKVTKLMMAYGRDKVRQDITFMGDFICHHTAYDENMNLRDPADHRQCKGATKEWRNGGKK